MNTTEKRKLESFIVSKTDKAREAYKNRRSREHSELVEQYHKNPPKEVQKIVDQRTAIEKRYKSEVEALDKKAKALGYNIQSNYDKNEFYARLCHDTQWGGRYNNTCTRVYHEPTLTAHDEETTTRIQEFEDLKEQYVVTVYAEGDDLATRLEEFGAKLEQLVA